MVEMSNVKAIQEFFTRKDMITPEGGRKVIMAEFKELSMEDRIELGELCRAELGGLCRTELYAD